MTQTEMPNFDIPQEMRKFAERSVAQAREAFEGFAAAAQSAVSELEGRTDVAQAGLREVGGRAVDFAKQNVSSSFEFAQKLVQASNVDEVMQLQTDYVKAQMQTLNEQAEALGQAAAKAAAEQAKPKV